MKTILHCKSVLSVTLLITALSIATVGSLSQTPPVITTPPADTFAFTGDRASVSVTASGNAPLRYQWLLDGKPVPQATNRTYTIPATTTPHTDAWRAVVANDFGAVTSSVATVTVLPMVTNGPAVAGLETWDRALPGLMRRYGVPGGQLAVTYEGRLDFARSYGYADIRRAQPLQVDTLMRVASLSKAITGMAVMRLVEEGKLSLTNLVFPYLGFETPVYPGSTNDPRLAKITVRHLMQHAGGWDRETARNPFGQTGFDPTFWPDTAAEDLYPGKTGARATAEDFVRWVLGKPLQFEPGSRFAYGNIGFLTLGRIIEKAVGKPYATYVRELLAGVGATRPRITFDLPDQGLWTVAGSEEATSIPAPSEILGGVGPNIENRRLDLPLAYRLPRSNRDASGGWAMSAIDYARFTTGIDGLSTTPDLLNTSSLLRIQKESSTHGYFAGWYHHSNVVPDWYHTGTFFGTLSYCWMRSDKVTFVAIFNSNPDALLDDTTSTLDLVSATFPHGKYSTNDLFGATLSYEAWKARHFSPDERKQPSISGDHADPDGDGRPNLAEYAFHRNPRAPEFESDLRPAGVEEGAAGVGPGGISFRRLFLGHQLDYRVEVSSDLEHWSAFDHSSSPQTLNPDGSVQVVVRPQPSPEPSGARFYRIRAALSPRSNEPL